MVGCLGYSAWGASMHSNASRGERPPGIPCIPLLTFTSHTPLRKHHTHALTLTHTLLYKHHSEACAVCNLDVLAEPEKWEEAVALAVREIRRLGQFGLSASELSRYITAMLRGACFGAVLCCVCGCGYGCGSLSLCARCLFVCLFVCLSVCVSLCVSMYVRRGRQCVREL